MTKPMLLDSYYSIRNVQTAGSVALFEVTLKPDCKVYEGHFPDMPVAPGVYNIEMIKECVEQLIHKRLRLEYIPQCRFTTLITPEQHHDLEVRVELVENNDQLVKVKATIGRNEEVYLAFGGEYACIN